MTGEDVTEVLDLPVALDIGKGQVAHLGDDAAQNAVHGQEVIVDLHLRDEVEDDAIDNGNDNTCDESADGPLPRLLRGEMRHHLVLP